jgi:nucleoside-diphosphate-sugar epimerase
MEFDNLITCPFGIGEKLILELLRRGESVFTIFPTAKDVPMSFLGKKNIKYGFLKFEQDPLLERSMPRRVKNVIHLFELYGGKFSKIFRANTLATLLLLDWAKNAGAEKFVYLSSGEVYGSGTDIDEASPCKPHGFYATTKYQAEMLLKFYEKYFSIQTLRAFFPFGNDLGYGFVHDIACAIDSSISVESSYEMISPIFVDDIIAPLLKSRDTMAPSIYNLCGSPLRVAELIGYIEQAIGKSAKKVQIGETSLIGRNKLIQEKYGYMETPIRNAIEQSFVHLK